MVQVPQKPETVKSAFADNDSAILDNGQPNVGLFGWTTNDLTSVKDIITYVDAALKAAESAQANADTVAASLGRMEELNVQYTNVIARIDAQAHAIDGMYTQFTQLSGELIQYANDAKAASDTAKGFRDESKILRDEVIAYALQAIYKFAEQTETAGGGVTVVPSNGTVQHFILTQAETTIEFTPFTDPAGTSRQLTLMFTQGTGANVIKWPNTVKWNNSRTPVFSFVKDKLDVVSLLTKDSGAHWYGFYNGGWFDA